MDFMSAREAADKWGISQRRVAVLCSENRISQAMMVGNMAAVNIDIKELHNYEANISKVTLEEVKQAAQYLQSVAPQVSGILYPKKEQTDE